MSSVGFCSPVMIDSAVLLFCRSNAFHRAKVVKPTRASGFPARSISSPIFAELKLGLGVGRLHLLLQVELQNVTLGITRPSI